MSETCVVRPCKKILFGQETSMVLEMRLHSHGVSFPRACSAAPAQMPGAAAKRGGLGHLPAKPSGRFGPVIRKRVLSPNAPEMDMLFGIRYQVHLLSN